VSGIVQRRRRWHRLGGRLAGVTIFLLLTATLATGLQIREIRVVGAVRFPAREVESSLRFALGIPTVAAPAEALRNAARAVPWVADAQVQVSVDGVVTCTVAERVPVATAVDGGRRMLADAEGHLLAPAGADAPPLELVGFGSAPEERAAVLAAVAAIEGNWGARLNRAERVGPSDVRLTFAGTACEVVVDPGAGDALVAARRVHAAWLAQTGAAPQRLDARASGRVAVLPATTAVPQPAAEEAS